MIKTTNVEMILRVVKEANGIKEKDLRFALIKFYGTEISDQDISGYVEQLIRDKKLIALEYSQDLSSIRNFLIPAGSVCIIRGQVEKTHRI